MESEPEYETAGRRAISWQDLLWELRKKAAACKKYCGKKPENDLQMYNGFQRRGQRLYCLRKGKKYNGGGKAGDALSDPIGGGL